MVKNNSNVSLYKPTYSPKGFLLEYPSLNKNYWFAIFMRFLAFLMDIGIVIILWSILYFLVFNKSIYLPLIIPIIYFVIYNTLIPMITNGRTIGLFIARLRIVHKSGFYTSFSNLYFRGLCVGLYVIPILGQLLMITSFLSGFLTKGITLIGLISQTIVISNKTYEKLLKMESEYKKEMRIEI